MSPKETIFWYSLLYFCVNIMWSLLYGIQVIDSQNVIANWVWVVSFTWSVVLLNDSLKKLLVVEK